MGGVDLYSSAVNGSKPDLRSNSLKRISSSEKRKDLEWSSWPPRTPEGHKGTPIPISCSQRHYCGDEELTFTQLEEGDQSQLYSAEDYDILKRNPLGGFGDALLAGCTGVQRSYVEVDASVTKCRNL